jgi:hypothetical protein
MIYYGNRCEEARDALIPIADYAYKYGVGTVDMYFLKAVKVGIASLSLLLPTTNDWKASA